MHLYLLVPTDSRTPHSLEVNGRHWSLQSVNPDSSPFNSSFPVSDRTIPALQTFIRHRPSCEHIWIDAFCVPLAEPKRAQTLESMGYIYARAKEVLVVLSEAARPALERMQGGGGIGIEELAVLEREEWVERAWTYQEAVNSNVLVLTCEGEGSAIIRAAQFFECMSTALQECKGSVSEKLCTYPRLNAFEDIMLDFWMAGYEERAALNVMSNMDRRVQARKEDHFYAMIGAISSERASALGKVEPCEAFIRVCEEKGDFSFIYSAARREEVPGRRWRPVIGDLPSILPWHGKGTGQPGRLCEEGLWLDSMLVVQPAPPQEEARIFVEEWLTLVWKDESHGHQDLEEAAYATLQIMGFTGSQRWVSGAKGYFFPFEPVRSEQVIQILVSTAVVWRMGVQA